MAAQVVCISRMIGALGEEIGSLVAERLSYRYVDEQVIERAARLAQVEPKLVAEVEQRRPLMRRLVEKLAAARSLVDPAMLSPVLPRFGAGGEHRGERAQSDDLRLLIQAAIQEIANDGCAVIVAHAASMTLATRTDVLRVLVAASSETRAHRLVATQGIAPAAAVEAVSASDRDRGDYIRRFHGIAQELPTHYDLVVNTDAFTPEQASDVVVCAAQTRP